MDFNIFNAAMRAEFINSLQAAGQPAVIEPFTLTVPSTARFENYAWMTPAPGLDRYRGYRRLAQMSNITYQLINREFDASFSVPTRDVEDDQVGGYKMRAKDLAVKAKSPFKNRLVLQQLALGKSTLCFDQSNFFGTTHKIGGYNTSIPGSSGNQGGNLLGYTATGSSDGVVHRFVVMVANPDSPLKPMIFQNRKEAKFMTDMGTEQSSKAKKGDYWVDLECTVGYGYWWDAVMVEVTNTPSVLDLVGALQVANNALMQFSLPVSLPTDPLEYPHEQHIWTPDNTAVVCSAGLKTLLEQVLGQTSYGISPATGSTTGITTNSLYYKKFTLIPTNQLNSGVNGL